MKRVEVIIYTSDLKKLSKTLNAKGFIFQEVMYDGQRVIDSEGHKVITYVYNLTNGVKIRIVMNDDLVGTLTDTLRSFENCSFYIFPLEEP